MALSRRRQVSERASGRCEYCRLPQDLDVQPFQIDHVRARKHSGSSSLSNLAWCCLPCNVFNGSNIAGYDPETETLRPLYHPRRQIWSEHFEWSGATLIGKTPCGRATVQVLNINRPERQEFRQILMEAGLFP